MPFFLTVLQNTENARAGGEFKGLILATTVKYEIFAAGVFLRYVFFCNFPNRSRKIYLSLIPNRKKKSVNLGACNSIFPACKGPSLISHKFSGFLIRAVPLMM